jgi:acyl dehydratase
MSERQATFPSTSTYDGTVDEDAVAAFALATNDHNPRYLDGQAVPPLFTATLILRCEGEAQRLGIGHDDVLGARGSVHGQHDVHFHGLVRPGMALCWSAATFGAHATKGGVLVVQRVMVTDQHGLPLVEHLWSSFHMGATIATEVGGVPPDHSFPEEVRRRPFGTKVITVDRDQAFRYAGVSGDHAGHAISDDIAQIEGYPSKILQGMCTFGLASGALVDLVADGDAYRIRRLSVRFARPAFPRRDLEINVYDAGLTEGGARAFAFEGVQDGVTVLKHGRVELVSR